MSKKTKTKKQAKQEMSFERASNIFNENIENIEFILPVVVSAVFEKGKKSSRVIETFLKKNAHKRSGKNYAIRIENIEDFDEIYKEHKNVRLAIKNLPKSLFLVAVAHLDNYLREILKVIYRLNEDLLNNTEKNISITELFELGSFNEAKQYVLDREIDRLLETRFACIEWLEKRFGIKFNFDKTVWANFIELTERRNLFVHQGGIVNKRYIDTCKKYGIKVGSKIGEELDLNPRYFLTALATIHLVGTQLGQSVWRKLKPSALKEADEFLLEVEVDLLNRNKNGVANKICDFANSLTTYFSEETKFMFLINKALALKFMGDKNAAEKFIKKYDWSATENKFKLAVAVIKDNSKEASEIMLMIGKSDDIKEGYRSWPLFKEFRKTRLFFNTYKKVFSESFVIRKAPPKLSPLKSNR